MSERRDRRRLHARARALGVPIEQVDRRFAPQRKPLRPPGEPLWPRTALPDRDEATTTSWQVPPETPAVCCAITRTRQVLDGGAVIILSAHAASCPIWSAR